jgi:hypothetical protein
MELLGHEAKLTVLHDGVGRDYRGRNGQRRLAKVLSGLSLLLDGDQSQRGQEPNGRGDEKRVTMGEGGLSRWPRSDGYMSWCLDGHGWMSSNARACPGIVRCRHSGHHYPYEPGGA